VLFNPEDPEQLRTYETINGLEGHSILKAEWIKPPKDRKALQRVATLRFFHKDANSANKILSEGASILNKRVIPKKPKKEPIRCLHCQRFGHERRSCKADMPACGKCAGSHETDTCPTDRTTSTCPNCTGRHPSYSRDCPKFREKCRQTDTRCPENKLAFYPTNDPWTWATDDQTTDNNPPPPSSPPQQPNSTRQVHPHYPQQTRLTGANDTPMGRTTHPSRQPFFQPHSQ
jgi:hypothetical protein